MTHEGQKSLTCVQLSKETWIIYLGTCMSSCILFALADSGLMSDCIEADSILWYTNLCELSHISDIESVLVSTDHTNQLEIVR